jgi:pyruvate dehydrogenase E1 component
MDTKGCCVKRMGEVRGRRVPEVFTEGGAYIRKHSSASIPELKEMVAHLSDEDIWRLRGRPRSGEGLRGLPAAVNNTGQPTVILAKTIKGYGLGEAGEGKNITHQQKKLNEEELREFRDRFDIPISETRIWQRCRSTGRPRTARK